MFKVIKRIIFSAALNQCEVLPVRIM